MSAPTLTKPARSWLNILAWPLLFGFVLLSIIIALQWMLSLDVESSFFELLSYPRLSCALAIQGLVALISILSWQYNLRLHGLKQMGFRQASVMMGINAVGKYSPGKVLGILARGAALLRISGDSRIVLQATMVEQLCLFHSGAAVAACAFLMQKNETTLALLLVIFAAFSVFLIARSGELVIRIASRIMRKPLPEDQSLHGFKQSYRLVFMLMTLVWLLSGLTLYFCIEAYNTEQTMHFWDLLMVATMAYLSGFLAFFSLAGLGVREGVMVVMLSAHMDLGIAVYISILHRVVTLLIDLLTGSMALLFGKSFLKTNTGGELDHDNV